jgi:putative transposase
VQTRRPHPPKKSSRKAATAIQPMGSFNRLTYHIVFATKYRKPSIKEDIRERLYEYIGGILRGNKGSLIQIGGVEDHVHLLVRLSPTRSMSEVIRDVKACSSKWMGEVGHVDKFEWQKGYGAFTVSFDRVDTIRKYIQNQKEHHKTMTFQEEYIDFLERHGIEFKLEYLFEDEQNG